jgi:uncharacterized membrane protein YfcA
MIEPIIVHGLIYLLIGIFAGLMAGLFGVGGGLVVVPGLVFIFQQINAVPDEIIMYVAVGSSLAAMIITSQAAVRAHYKMGNILWPIFQKLYPGLIAGTIVGAFAAAWIPTYWLKIFFGLFLFLVAFKMILEKELEQTRPFPKEWITNLVTFFVGIVSGILGVGGGILIVPFIAHFGVPTRKIAAISNVCALTISIVGTLIFMMTGIDDTHHIPYMTGYVYWPAVLLVGIASCFFAPIGTKLNYILPIDQLKYGFILLLILTGIKMLF